MIHERIELKLRLFLLEGGGGWGGKEKKEKETSRFVEITRSESDDNLFRGSSIGRCD